MEFLTWLRNWLLRHPLKEPTDAERSDYTADVMAKVRALDLQPVRAPVLVPARSWGWWPRLAMAMATAAGLAFALSTTHQTRRQLAQQPQGVTVSELDEEWLEQTLELLEQLEGETSPETAGDGSEDDEWLDELQWLDESELSTAS